MNCVIIEDEAVAARRLRQLIEQNKVEVLAVLHSVKEAIEWFKTHSAPDIIFLDIQLGDGISFEIFEAVNPQSAIIFTTAYDQYALRAFKLNSIDYLLKPIQERELQKALQKYKTFLPEKPLFSAMELRELLQPHVEDKYRERFVVKIGQKLKTIDTKEIPLVFSKDKSTYIFLGNRNYPIDYSLEEVMSMLNPACFYRISRQAIIHIHYIEEITAHSGNRLLLKIKGNPTSWVVSRERVAHFKAWLER